MEVLVDPDTASGFKQGGGRHPQTSANEWSRLEASYSGNSYVGLVSWFSVWLGGEVTHALCTRHRTTRQHAQWSLRRGGKSDKDGDNMWMRIPRAKKTGFMAHPPLCGFLEGTTVYSRYRHQFAVSYSNARPH